MNVCWIISQDITSDSIAPAIINSTGTSWGSWQSQKVFNTDNCVCIDFKESCYLINQSFHTVCNLYITKENYLKTGNPIGVKLFNGQFKNISISNKEDVVALNLAVPTADIVLLAGFNFSPLLNTDDKDIRDSRLEYYFNVREIIRGHPQTQFVLVDYKYNMASWVQELDNLTEDTAESVKNLLG